MVGSSDQMPDWFKKYKGIKKELDDQLLRGLETPGEGLTLNHLQALVEHRNPFTEAVQPVRSYMDKLSLRIAKLLSKRFGKRIIVDPAPDWFTEENLAKALRFNLRPIFLPDEEVDKDRLLRNWVKPQSWFYNQIKNGKIAKDSAYLKRGWYLADFTIGADYSDGLQIFQNDPLAPIIARLRQEGKIGKLDKIPIDSRFAIVPRDEWPLLIAVLVEEELEISSCSYDEKCLERAIEFNAIGNLYDKNRGMFNMREWFADAFGDDTFSFNLYGGNYPRGGLTVIYNESAGFRDDHFAGRPLISF